MYLKITGSSNNRLKISRNLRSRSYIMKHRAFLMEGSRFVADYLRNSEPKWIILSEEATPASRAVVNDVSEAGIDILEIPLKLFSEISDTAHSQGIIAICELPWIKENELEPEGSFLLLDRISDPGNIGTIIRSAAAFGCSSVIMGKGCCFPFLPKVTRASAGANVKVPLLYDIDLPSLMLRNSDNCTFIGAEASGGPMEQIKASTGSIGIVIGSEAHGISEKVHERLDGTVSIPMKKGVESLNAAVSASILLYAAGNH
ncbi:MAG: RNA methyltransferase [Candidatus Aegiribacteria sp.]|nr:RNA methyltransferase [Candidatus Aegiribacteria sp.]